MDDTYWMQLALVQAQLAQDQGEVPVGAVLIKDNRCIATGYNQPIALCDPTAHAEIQALRQAGQQLVNYRLLDTTLYVTLEPCLMCIGAILHARIQRLVFGAYDPKTGAVSSKFQIPCHPLVISGGVCQEKCASLLTQFFRARR